MVKGVILDVDGVIVGEKLGFNFPDPHPKVITKLQQVRKSGIPIALCTAKPIFSINKLVKKLKLDNYHIADGGGVVANPIQNKVVAKKLIPNSLASNLTAFFLPSNTYIELYNPQKYIIQKSQKGTITKKHIPILFQKPEIVDSILKSAQTEEITKIMLIAKNEKDKQRIDKLLDQFRNKLNVYWGLHPSALPLQFGVITAKGVSKENGAKAISKNLNVSFNNLLAVGDSIGDWQFIKLCKYKGAVGNATQELKDLVTNSNGYIGPGVDKNGIIDILDHFLAK